MRKAIEDYSMIQDNDRIALGISGGKDSLVMLVAMARLREFLPYKFDIEAITIDLGFEDFDTSPIQDLCDKLNVNYTNHKTHIKEIVFEIRNEKKPCSLCANLRRGALDNVAKKLNCNKVALAHHNDDVVTTVMMSLLYTGRFHTFSPLTYMSRKDLYVIRPMIFVKENDIKAESERLNLTVVKNPCPADNDSGRKVIKDFINNIETNIPDVKSLIFNAIKKAQINGWK